MGTSEDLTKTLLLIPCSAEKKGNIDPGLPDRAISEFLSTDAHSILGEGRKLALSGRIDLNSPRRPALAYYTGQPYATPEFRFLLIQVLHDGVHCLIISGGYGLLRPEEPIHSYSAHLATETGAIWRRRLPEVIRDYVRNNGIRRIFGAFSRSYAAYIPRNLAEENWWAVPSFDRRRDRGSPMRVVPTKVGALLASLLRNRLSPGEGWTRC